MDLLPTDFKDKTLQQIRWWAWAAAVMPIVGLSAVFFVWVFGTADTFNTVMIIGETTMFATAVLWWWWAIYVINRIVRQWDTTRKGVSEVLVELKEVKQLARDTFNSQSDK